MERSEAVLFLLECDSRRDPWQKSFFGEGFRLGALPNGSGGREDDGELEKTSVPWGLHLRPLCVGMGILGDTEGTTVGDEMVEQPLGMSTTSEKSSSEQEASVGGLRHVGLLLHWMGSNVGSSSKINWLRFSREMSRSGSSWWVTVSCAGSKQIVWPTLRT